MRLVLSTSCWVVFEHAGKWRDPEQAWMLYDFTVVQLLAQISHCACNAYLAAPWATSNRLGGRDKNKDAHFHFYPRRSSISAGIIHA